MKKILASLLLALLVIVACEKAEPDNNKNENGKPNNKVENITIPSTVDTTPTVTEGKDSVKVQFTAATSWTASIINTKADNWCTVYPTSGPAGNVEIEIKVTENTTPDERSATINIVSGETTKSITVTQKQKDALTITESSMEVPAEGGEVAIEVKANVSFKHTVDADASSWIKYINTKALKTSNMIFDIMENDDLDSRKGCIYVTDGTLTDTITIYQAGGKPFIVLGSNEVSLEPTGGSFDIEVRHNVDATLEPVFPKGVTPWLKEVQSKAASTNKYTFAADENTTYSSRTAMIIALNRDASVADTVYVTQKQNNAIILGNDLYYLSCKGGEFNIKIQSNVKATAEPLFPANVTPWFEKSSTKALTDSTYSFIAQENTAIEPRTAHVVFKNTETNITDTVTVTQYQKGLVIGEKAFTIEMQGGNIKVDLTEDASVQVKYETNDTGGWIDASVSNKQCILNIAKNESYSNRNALILLNNADNSYKDTIQITQKQTNAIILGNKECYVKSAGGEFTIRVQSNVSATAQPVFPENVQPWFRASETKALTESTYTYSADENSSSQPRSAIIIFQNTESNVADTVTVTQYQKGLILGEKVVNVTSSACNYTIDFIENARFSKSFEIEGNNGWIEAQVDGKKGVLNISRNATYDKRALGLIFSSLDNKITDTLKVYQAQNDTLMIDVNDTLRTLDSREQVITIKVDNNIDLTSSVQCESGDWIHKVETKGLKTSSFDFLIDENTGETQRKGYITFASTDGSLNKTLTVVQDAVYSIVLSEDTLSFNWNDAGATIATISVESSVDYDFKKLLENRYSYFSVDNITDNQYEVYTNFENHTFGCNKNYIMFYNEEYNISDTLFVIQFGKPQVKDTDDNSLNEVDYIYSDQEQQIKIPIKANYNFNLNIKDGNDWITEGAHIIKHNLLRELYLDTLVFNLSKNMGGSRSATIEFATEENDVTDIITITQESTTEALEVNVAEIGKTISIEDIKRRGSVKLTGEISSVDLTDLIQFDENTACAILDLSELVMLDGKLGSIRIPKVKELYLPQAVKRITHTFLDADFEGYYDRGEWVQEVWDLEKVYFGENSQVETIESHYTPKGPGGYAGPSFAVFEGAFTGLKHLKSVVLPASLKELYGGAFLNSGLESISMEACTQITSIKPSTEANYGFLSGVRVKHLILPPNVTKIEDYAFNGCQFIEITINDNIELSPLAFYGAGILKVNSKYSPDGQNVVMDNSLVYIAPRYDVEEYTLPSGITSVRSDIFDGLPFYKFIFPDNMEYMPEGLKLNGMEYLEEVILPSNLKEIPSYFLAGNENIKNIDLPATLEKIGDYAFQGRYFTGSVIVTPAMLIEEITLGENLKEIGEYAFSGAHIKTLKLPASLQHIGSSAFSGCLDLKDVEFENGSNWANVEMGDGIFGSCEKLQKITLPEGMTKVPYGMFNCCYNLYNVKLPSSITSIGECTFQWCENLETIALPENLESIGAKAFSYTSLYDIVLPDKITDLAEACFKNCEALKEVKLPNNLKTIGKETFLGCTSLSNITLPDSLEEIGKDAFSVCPIETIVVPDKVKTIDEFAFSSCKSLKNITLSKNLEVLGSYAFTNCSSLESIIIPGSVKELGSSVFDNNLSLSTITFNEGLEVFSVDNLGGQCGVKSLTMPSTVREVNPRKGVSNSLESIYFTSATPPVNTGYPSADMPVILYVPNSYIDAYKNGNGWKNWVEYIKGY